METARLYTTSKSTSTVMEPPPTSRLPQAIRCHVNILPINVPVIQCGHYHWHLYFCAGHCLRLDSTHRFRLDPTHCFQINPTHGFRLDLTQFFYSIQIMFNIFNFDSSRIILVPLHSRFGGSHISQGVVQIIQH